tara:strand:- start:476 stop:1111 length:636 start_codon:yes stop_codon:yes gene_type:complete
LNDISKITQFGDFYQINAEFNIEKLFDELEDHKDKWAKYNPRKDWIKRDGLCILNERGECGPGPALDSLGEWNKEYGTKFQEEDFNVPTELYKESSELQRVVGPMLNWSVRSHFLRLPPGGYFPPHRDNVYGEQTSFRLIWALENCNAPHCRFMLEDKTLNFEYGQCYVVNTTKVHTLFNCSANYDSIWLVINAQVTDESIRFVQDNLSER